VGMYERQMFQGVIGGKKLQRRICGVPGADRRILDLADAILGALSSVLRGCDMPGG
jgi:hypothetical protein